MKKSSFFLKIFFCLMLVLVSLEVRLRVFSPLPFTVKGKKITLPANKEYVFVKKSRSGPDEIVRIKKNSLGFRGPEPDKQFKNDYTILVVGGSASAGDNLSEGKTWEDLLLNRLRETSKDI